MTSAPSIFCVIPARGDSKGVSRKNTREVAGKPLLAWTIIAAKNSGAIDRIVVSTEDPEIAEVARQYGAEVINRPSELAADTALTEPVMAHALQEVEKEGYHPDYISLIQCTSPLLSPEIIKQAVGKVRTGAFDSCVTLYYPVGHEFLWSKNSDDSFKPEHDVEHRPRRQDLPVRYNENGAFYITKTELFKKTNNRFGGNLARVGGVLMNETDSLQIDSEDHLWLAEQILKGRGLA